MTDHVIADGLYRVRNVGSGLLLEVADGSRRSGAKVQQGEDSGSDAQLWRLTAVHPGGALHHLACRLTSIDHLLWRSGYRLSVRYWLVTRASPT
ncbi:RICIN domain-containing protein, partial [Kitasatospora sp. NPDC092286]|uniref:RICIN domain-containing protein n=1 Tax=Kitasatospora sp. NPDC092286 TaxID=3364087 RepID=UPI00382C11D1